MSARPAIGGVALFWVATLVAGALAPGYSARADYVSSLAGRGSEVAVLGVAAVVVLGLAHLVAAGAVRGVVAVPLALAGAAGLTVAAFRVQCPDGAAGCGFGSNAPPADLGDTVHGLAVRGYEIALLAAMLVVVASRAWALWFRVLAAAAAPASLLLGMQIGGADNGWWQRGWLLVNTGWLVLLAVRALPRSRAP